MLHHHCLSAKHWPPPLPTKKKAFKVYLLRSGNIRIPVIKVEAPCTDACLQELKTKLLMVSFSQNPSSPNDFCEWRHTLTQKSTKSLEVQIVSTCSRSLMAELKERWAFCDFLTPFEALIVQLCASWAHEPPITPLGLSLSPPLSLPVAGDSPFKRQPAVSSSLICTARQRIKHLCPARDKRRAQRDGKTRNTHSAHQTEGGVTSSLVGRVMAWCCAPSASDLIKLAENFEVDWVTITRGTFAHRAQRCKMLGSDYL